MQYVLITTKGSEMKFHTKAAAELFKEMYGGYIVHAGDLKIAA